MSKVIHVSNKHYDELKNVTACKNWTGKIVSILSHPQTRTKTGIAVRKALVDIGLAILLQEILN